MYISKHFPLSEQRCKCGCGKGKLVESLLVETDDIREHYNKAMILTSAFRCWNSHVNAYKKLYGNDWNRYITKNSYHLTGEAIDFYIPGIQLNDLYTYLLGKYPDKFGVIYEPSQGIIHFDCRKVMYHPEPV
jgi:uncharacterized protein YcbK (DUF882 family)